MEVSVRLKRSQLAFLAFRIRVIPFGRRHRLRSYALGYAIIRTSKECGRRYDCWPSLGPISTKLLLDLAPRKGNRGAHPARGGEPPGEDEGTETGAWVR